MQPYTCTQQPRNTQESSSLVLLSDVNLAGKILPQGRGSEGRREDLINAHYSLTVRSQRKRPFPLDLSAGEMYVLVAF